MVDVLAVGVRGAMTPEKGGRIIENKALATKSFRAGISARNGFRT